MVAMMATAAHGTDAAQMRNCIASYFWEKRNNGLKWAVGIGTQIQICHSHGSNNTAKISPEDRLEAEF